MKLTSWRRKKSAPTIVMFFALAVIGLGAAVVSTLATSSKVQAQIGSNEVLVDKGSQYLPRVAPLVMVCKVKADQTVPPWLGSALPAFTFKFLPDACR